MFRKNRDCIYDEQCTIVIPVVAGPGISVRGVDHGTVDISLSRIDNMCVYVMKLCVRIVLRMGLPVMMI